MVDAPFDFSAFLADNLWFSSVTKSLFFSITRYFTLDDRISDTVSWALRPHPYRTRPPTGRCSVKSAPRTNPFPAFSDTCPHLPCFLYYSEICVSFQVTAKKINGREMRPLEPYEGACCYRITRCPIGCAHDMVRPSISTPPSRRTAPSPPIGLIPPPLAVRS